jgi:predicted AAA+ superfamily ATPase
MDAVYIQAALLEDKLVAAPKKNKKFIFNDPFIYHAIAAWLNPVSDPYAQQIKKNLEDPVFASKMVEACVINHFRRRYEKTFYISAAGEVDVAYVDQNRFWPIEIKWAQQLRPEALKQIQKYKNGQIWARVDAFYQVESTLIHPLPWALLAL